MKLEDLQPDATVRGILPDAAVTVVNVQWYGSDALTLVYRGPNGRVADEILYRHDWRPPRRRSSIRPRRPLPGVVVYLMEEFRHLYASGELNEAALRVLHRLKKQERDARMVGTHGYRFSREGTDHD